MSPWNSVNKSYDQMEKWVSKKYRKYLWEENNIGENIPIILKLGLNEILTYLLVLRS